MDQVKFDRRFHSPAMENMIRGLEARGIRSKLVLKAMRETFRPHFVDLVFERRAYEDRPFPIGQGQTISQPYMVALMTQLLLDEDGRAPDKVLEIGTGSGYQTAILEKIGVKDIYSIERIRSLHEKAKTNLRAARCVRSRLILGDGSKGLPKHAPYDGILVAAAAPRVPDELTDQLREGGKLVIPVDNPESGVQDLLMIERSGYRCISHRIASVLFVPLLEGEVLDSGQE